MVQALGPRAAQLLVHQRAHVLGAIAACLYVVGRACATSQSSATRRRADQVSANACARARARPNTPLAAARTALPRSRRRSCSPRCAPRRTKFAPMAAAIQKKLHVKYFQKCLQCLPGPNAAASTNRLLAVRARRTAVHAVEPRRRASTRSRRRRSSRGSPRSRWCRWRTAAPACQVEHAAFASRGGLATTARRSSSASRGALGVAGGRSTRTRIAMTRTLNRSRWLVIARRRPMRERARPRRSRSCARSRAADALVPRVRGRRKRTCAFCTARRRSVKRCSATASARRRRFPSAGT